jgi:hypothetical protein
VKDKDEMEREKLAKKQISLINRDVVVFAFFLFLSFCLWYFNYLGKEMEADIKFPVKYVNIPNGMEVSLADPPRLSFSLRGSGYSVLKLKVSGNKPPAIIDLTKSVFKRVPNSKAPEYFIVTSGLTKTMAIQIRSGCEISSIKPDTIFFTLKKISAKQSPAAN